VSQDCPGGFGNTRVKGAPRLAQEHAVGHVLHQGVLEQVARIRWDALRRQQTGFQQAIEEAKTRRSGAAKAG
jgi:hypothetical protein